MTGSEFKGSADISLVDSQLDLDALNQRFEEADTCHLITWAVDSFGDQLVMTTSFGIQSAVMLHLVTSIVPTITVIWIDTGFNFPETYRFAEVLGKRLDLNLHVHQSDLSPARMVAMHGHLWEQGTEGLDRYDRIRKITPRDRAFHQLNVKASLSGLRREQTQYRKSLRKVELFDGVVKIHPILHWSTSQVDEYLKKHDLPYHPLREQGYPSVGDWHSTAPATGESDPRAGRFRGLKQECGLHLPQSDEENASRESSEL